MPKNGENGYSEKAKKELFQLEQGKETVRMDKVNQALSMFGMEAVPGKKERNE